MMVFISGGVRSGKSTLGEKYAKELAELSDGNKIYLATAKVCDDEMKRRVRRHQKLREQKGYITIEKSENLGEIVPDLRKTDTVLLDCLGNLTANEMFGDTFVEFDDDMKTELTEKIFADITKINESVKNFIIISNEVFSSGLTYENTTEDYMDVLGWLHVKIAAVSQIAVECVYGYNILHKGAAL